MKKLYVSKSHIQGSGIYTSETIKAGEHIAFLSGKIVRKKTKTAKEALSIPLWYGITDVLWLNPENTIWCFFNHSCNPNTAITGTKKVIALKNIKANSELTFDYSMTDGDLLWHMNCNCGAADCRRIIRSIQNTPERYLAKHYYKIPKFFLKLRKEFIAGFSA